MIASTCSCKVGSIASRIGNNKVVTVDGDDVIADGITYHVDKSTGDNNIEIVYIKYVTKFTIIRIAIYNNCIIVYFDNIYGRDKCST